MGPVRPHMKNETLLHRFEGAAPSTSMFLQNFHVFAACDRQTAALASRSLAHASKGLPRWFDVRTHVPRNGVQPRRRGGGDRRRRRLRARLRGVSPVAFGHCSGRPAPSTNLSDSRPTVGSVMFSLTRTVSKAGPEDPARGPDCCSPWQCWGQVGGAPAPAVGLGWVTVHRAGACRHAF